MKAPDDLVLALDAALRGALQALAAHPARERVDKVARAALAPDAGLRAIRAALLGEELRYLPREYEAGDDAYRAEEDAYRGAVRPAAAAALELLAYDDVERYVLANRDSRDVRELLGFKEATDRMRASVFGRPRDVCVTVGAHRLVFVAPDAEGSAATLVLDGRARLGRVLPRVREITGWDGRYVVVAQPLPREEVPEGGVRAAATRPAVIDLARSMVAALDADHQPAFEAGCAVVGIDEKGVVVRAPGGERRCVPLDALSYEAMKPA